MSSPRKPAETNGLIRHGDHCTGPIHLPGASTDQFLEEFNQCYRDIGLRIEFTYPKANQTHSDSQTSAAN